MMNVWRQADKPKPIKLPYGRVVWVVLLCLVCGTLLMMRPMSYVVFELNTEREPHVTSEHLPCVWTEDKFALEWRHSVEKRLWQEFYQIKDGKLLLTHTFLETFGAGTPNTNKIIESPEGFLGMRSDVSYDELNWVVSRRMQGVVFAVKSNYIQKNQSFEIYKSVPDYSTIHIEVNTKSWLSWQLMEKCHDQS